MDEMLFRSADKLEELQFKLGVAANEGKHVLAVFCQQSKRVISQYWQSSSSLDLQARLRHVFEYIIHVLHEVRNSVEYHVQPLLSNFTWHWINTPLIAYCAGFLIGTTFGFVLGRFLYREYVIIHREKMLAIQCLKQRTNRLSLDAVGLVLDAQAPHRCRPDEVIVEVEAGSIQLMDLSIARGYGRRMRYLLNKYHKTGESSYPVTLGRDCVGTVLAVGAAVRRLEVGDAVWAAVPYWAPGLLAQRVLLPESCVAVRPSRLGAQAACSFPYAGALALRTLRTGLVTRANAQGKRVLIIGGCTPVGCLLLQVLSAWGAHVSATCPVRAPPVMEALGATYIIPLRDNHLTDGMVNHNHNKLHNDRRTSSGDHLNDNATDDDEDYGEEAKNHQNTDENPDLMSGRHLTDMLEQRGPFDLIVVTQTHLLHEAQLRRICVSDGIIVDTRPGSVESDGYGMVRGAAFEWWAYIGLVVKDIFGLNDFNDYNETPMDFEVLDQLSGLIDKFRIKPVVGKVYHATDIASALNQVASTSTIGTTVLTFNR